MTTTFQLSEKGGPSGQGILVVKVEAPDDISPDIVWGVFAQAVQLASLDGTLDNFDALVKARETALAALPGATVVVQPQPTNTAPTTWGNPPVPPMLPAAAQAPAVGAAPACHHGTKEFISGISKQGKPWKAWACPAPRGQQCDKEWIRD